MANQEYPNVDGVAVSWSDIKVTASVSGGSLAEAPDIQNVNTGRTLEIGEQKRAGVTHKRTRGMVSQEASLTFYRDGYHAFMDALAEAAPLIGNERKLGLVTFDVFVQHEVPGDPRKYMRKLYECRIGGDTMNSAEGTDAQVVEVPLHTKRIADIREDGTELVLL